MDEQALIAFIKASLAEQTPEEKIRGDLLSVGWAPAMIDSAFIKVRQSMPVSSPAPTPPPSAPSPITMAPIMSPQTLRASMESAPAYGASVSDALHRAADAGMASRSRRGIHIAIGIAVMLLLMGGGVGLAYWQGAWPFGGRLVSGRILIGILANATKIESAGYAISFEMSTEKRADDVAPFTLSEAAERELEPFSRDKTRFEDLRTILTRTSCSSNDYYLNALNSKTITATQRAQYQRMLKQCPRTLQEAGLELTDPLTLSPYTYARSAAGTSFSITVTFETDAAIEAIRARSESPADTVVKGKDVTFSPGSSGYYSMKNAPSALLFHEAVTDMTETFFPSNFRVSGHLNGQLATDAEEGKTPDAEFSIGGDFEYEDFSAAAEFHLTKSDDDVYFQVEKMPGLFFADLSGIKGKWVRYSPDDAAVLESSNDSLIQGMLEGISEELPVGTPLDENAEEKEEERRVYGELARLFVRLAESEGAIVPGDPVTEKLDGAKVSKYMFRLEPEKFLPFYETFMTEGKKIAGDVVKLDRDEDLVATMKSESFKNYARYLADHTTIAVWAQKGTNIPIKFEYDFRFAPPKEANRFDRMIHINTSVALKNVNKRVTITPPKEYMSFEDAIISLSGMTKEEYRFENQRASITAIFRALGDYHSWSGSYPSSLTDLEKKRSEVTQSPGVGGALTETNSYFKELPFLKHVPKDIYTREDFPYRKTGDGVELTYTIELPPYKQGIAPDFQLYTDAQMLIYQGGATSGAQPAANTLTLRFVKGKNTATTRTLSREALDGARVDTDQDLLTDNFEAYLGTDPRKKDTDGDGMSDGAELNSGRDPLGRSRLKSANEGEYGVLSSLSDAQIRAKDASIKANISGLRVQAELHYDSNNDSYAGVCSNKEIISTINTAKTQAEIIYATNTTLSRAGSNGVATCHENGKLGYAVEVPLKSDPLSVFCVDHTGTAKVTATELTANDITCN